VEVLPAAESDPEQFNIAAIVRRLYDIGVFPDWWKLESPTNSGQWEDLGRTIVECDPECRGVILLGKGVPLQELCVSLRSARKHTICKGFAVGRSIFQLPVDKWFGGECSADECRQAVERNFRALIQAWDSAKQR
jgi:5-dehydro-2-deoxygluconokinase